MYWKENQKKYNIYNGKTLKILKNNPIHWKNKQNNFIFSHHCLQETSQYLPFICFQKFS